MKRFVSLIVFMSLAFSLLPSAFATGNQFSKVQEYKAGQFSDVAESDWYASSVKTVYEYGIMQGSGDSFGAKNSLTIAETITMAARLHSRYYTGADTFGSSSPWYQVYVDYALEKGLISQSYPDYSQPATRTVFVSILRNALPSDALTKTNEIDDGAIPDVPTNAQGASAIYDFYRAGILTGSDAKGTFLPSANIDRASVAAIVARMVEPSLRLKITLTVPKVTVFAKDSDETLVVPITQVESYVAQGWDTVPHEFSLDDYFDDYNQYNFVAEYSGVIAGYRQPTWEYSNRCLVIGGQGTFYPSSQLDGINKSNINEIYLKRGIDWSAFFWFGDLEPYSSLRRIEIPDTMDGMFDIGSYDFAFPSLTRIGIPESAYLSISSDTPFGEAELEWSGDYRIESKYYLKNRNLVIYCVPGSSASEFAEKFHVRQVAATQVFHLDGRTCMVSASEKPTYLANGWFETPVTLMYHADGSVQAVALDEVDAHQKDGWYLDKNDFVVLYSTHNGEAKVVGKNEKSSYTNFWEWNENLSKAFTTIYAEDGKTLTVLKSAVADYEQGNWHEKIDDAKITMYAPDGRTISIWKAETEAYKAVGWYTQPMTVIYSTDGRTLTIATADVPAYEKEGWSRNADAVNTTMYALDGRTQTVPNAKIAENQAAGWYLYPDYVCAKADATVTSDGYAAAVEYVESIMESSTKESYYSTLVNKRNSLCSSWQKSIGCPVAILRSTIGHNSIGVPTVHITYRNLTGSTLNAFELKFTCVDAYGKVTTDWPTLYDGTFTGYSDTANLPPYSVGSATWTLNSNERTTSIRNLHILRAVFSDGTIWQK